MIAKVKLRLELAVIYTVGAQVASVATTLTFVMFCYPS
jgi:hypothetical protein